MRSVDRVPCAALKGLVSAHVNMASEKLRRRVAWEAARLMYAREESEYFRAKMKAARRITRDELKPSNLPSNREIRDQIEALARRHKEHPEVLLEQDVPEAESQVDRFQIYEMLLVPLERVKEDRRHHPEGDVLYHSLQVFELARQERPYDEEFLLAALLHDVGKAIDRKEHVAAALESLDGFVTERTAWLIEHHTEAHALLEGTLGARGRRRLTASEDFEELVLLAECDRDGRATGVEVPDVEDALAYVHELAETCGE